VDIVGICRGEKRAHTETLFDRRVSVGGAQPYSKTATEAYDRAVSTGRGYKKVAVTPKTGVRPFMRERMRSKRARRILFDERGRK